MSIEKTYPIALEKDYFICMANDIVKGKQDMTLQEARVIRLLITQIVKQDTDLKTYKLRINDFAKFVGRDSSNFYRDIFKFCDNLLDRKVYIGTGNPKQPWKMFQWLQCAEYDGNGTLTFMLSEQIKPFVVGLEAYFTQYQLRNILAMNSYYAIRLYELIKCEENKTRNEKIYHEFTITYLRSYFSCEEKYDRISQFKKKVVEAAIKEINEKSDLFINVVEYITTGRATTSIRFYAIANLKNTIKLTSGEADESN
ncbi:replication initiation protein (plasmid) [Oscillospiraceae bacterium PP1C4]